MEKRLAGAFEAFDQRFHRAAMVAARRVDDGVSGFGFGDQQIAVVERTDDRLDAEALQFSSMLLVANQARHAMACAHETRRNRSTDKTACASDEDVQDVLL